VRGREKRRDGWGERRQGCKNEKREVGRERVGGANDGGGGRLIERGGHEARIRGRQNQMTFGRGLKEKTIGGDLRGP